MGHRPWIWFLLVGAVLVLAEGVFDGTGVGSALYLLTCAFGTAGVLVGLRLHKPHRPVPWLLLAAGAAIWLVGDVVWVVLDRPGMAGVLVSPADGLYLAGYVVLAAALLRLVGRSDVGAGLDALIVGVAVAALLWTVLVRPQQDLTGVDTATRAVGLGYPVLASILVAYLVHLVFSGVRRTTALHLLGVGFTAVLVGDVLYQTMIAYPGLGLVDNAVEPFWTLGYVLWGTAALHPSMRSTTPVAEAEVATPPGGARIALLVLAGLTLPAIAFAEAAIEARGRSVALAAFGIVLIVLVGARFWMLGGRLRLQAERLVHTADHDFLTGLLNRRALLGLLAAGTRGVREGGSARPAVVAVGLERFQEFSATLGHRIGDELLRAVGARLRTVSTCPDVRHVRLGGDVFAVLVPDATELDDVLDHSRAIAAALREPFVVSDLEVDVEVSIGVVRVGDHGLDPAELLHRADVALMAARTVPGGIAVWEPSMEAGGALAPELMAELGQAIADGRIVAHYQPQVDVRTGRVNAVEALARWEHPVHGLLAPAAFIPAAERTGQIRALTRCVLHQALSRVAASDAAGRPLAVSVNLSVRNLLDPRLVHDVREALAEHDVDPRLLELEITETSAMVDPERSATVLGALAALGVTISIDDYGTGYGSLAYLQDLPIGRLKIDRSFVGRVCVDEPSAAIVRSVIELSNQLGLSVVAEGVEDDRTLVALQGMGCGLAQGFGLAHPVPADRLDRVVQELERRLPAVLKEGAVVR